MHSQILEEELRTRFALNLRNHRTSKGISQESLGVMAGLHRTFVSQVERGLANITLDNIRKLSNALELDPMELLRPIKD